MILRVMLMLLLAWLHHLTAGLLSLRHLVQLLIIQPELVEAKELSLHKLLDHCLIPDYEALLRECILRVLQ